MKRKDRMPLQAAKIFPSSVLFVCSTNTVRSPIAEGLLRYLLGHKIYVLSAGVRQAEMDGFTIAVMAEWDIDLSQHSPRVFADLDDTSFDRIITLSPEAHHLAMELTRSIACEVEFWPTLDPTGSEASRERRLQLYRDVRAMLLEKILTRFQLDVPSEALAERLKNRF